MQASGFRDLSRIEGSRAFAANHAIAAIAAIALPLAVAFATVVSLGACASGPRLRHKHEYTLSPGQEYHAGLKTALLIPIDQTNAKPVKGLDVANDRIAGLVASHLEAKGLRVVRVEPGAFRKAMDGALAAAVAKRKSGATGSVSAQIEFGDLVPEILSRLEKSADLVVAPNIAMRGANYQGTRTIAWDGVRRRETVANMTMSGSGLPAASLFVAVHAKDGARVFSGYGGLEPVFRIDTAATKYVQREDLFEDERNLREGICIAFYPYFGMGEFCSR